MVRSTDGGHGSDANEGSGSQASGRGQSAGGVFANAIDGRPAYFHLYILEDGSDRTLTPDQVEILTDKITEHGGILTDEETEADTIIVNHAGVDFWRDMHSASIRTYVESPGFVDKCIRTGVYRHFDTPMKGMGGPRRSIVSRRPFTADDEENMCQYLAVKIPDKEAGGRTGPGIWRMAVDMSKEEVLPPKQNLYAWARTHPEQSWQEHYKRNAARLDQRIDEIVAELPPRQGNKGMYPFDRRLGRAGRGLRLKPRDSSEDRDVSSSEGERPFSAVKKEPEWEEEEESDSGIEDVPAPRLGKRSRQGSYDMSERSNLLRPRTSGSDDAGPSGTRHTPIPSRHQAPDSLQKETPRSAHSRHSHSAARTMSHNAPMDSQATLVSTQARPPPANDVPPPPAVQSKFVTKKRGKRIAALRGPGAPVDAPYRNTRARSRSVEPAPTVKSRSQAEANLEVVEETVEGDVIHDAPAGETNQEEADVLSILEVGEEENNGSISHNDFRPQQSVTKPESPDDLRTDDQLFGHSSSRARMSEEAFADLLDVSNPDADKQAQERSRYRMVTPARASTSAQVRLRASLPSGSVVRSSKPRPSQVASHTYTRRQNALEGDDGRAPRARRAESNNSDSTADHDSIPIPGTRASQEKRKVEERVRKSAYKPPSGTRAATVALRTQRN